MRITGAEAPYYDEIIIKFYSEESTRFAELQAGNLDAAYVTQATYVNNLSSGSVSGSVLVQKVSQGVTGIQLAAGPTLWELLPISMSARPSPMASRSRI